MSWFFHFFFPFVFVLPKKNSLIKGGEEEEEDSIIEYPNTDKRDDFDD